MTEKELTDIAYKLSQMYSGINARYIERMGRHIKQIGKLKPKDVHIIEQYMRMNYNIEELKKEMAIASNKTQQQLNDLLEKMYLDEYKDNKYLYDFRNVNYHDIRNNIFLQQYINSILNLTHNSLFNMSNTTALSTSYQQLVDKGIYAVSNGLDDFNSVIRNTVQEAGVGARVEYASGLTRRLDSAARMNILDGTRQIWLGIHEQGGEMFGADGVEISAHALCATDHIPIQGKQFIKEEYAKLQASESFTDYKGNTYSPIKRHIGIWNCKHHTFPIVLGISEPTYTDEQLQQYKNYSNEKFTINGREYTRYQCSQLMRQAETSMRYSKDSYIFANAMNDTEGMAKAQSKLLKQQAKYREISSATGLKKEYNRAYVPGYRGTGNNQPSKYSHNVSSSRSTIPKDLTKTLKLSQLDTDKPLFEQILYRQGFEEFPRVVNKTKFSEYVKDSKFIAQRTFTLATKEDLDKAVEELRYGKWRLNTSGLNARYGKGMYTYSNYEGILSDDIHTKINTYIKLYREQNFKRYGSAYTTVETYTLEKNANIVNYLDIAKDYDAFIKQSNEFTYKNLDIGTYAVMRGFDAIRVDDKKIQGIITVILNRGKLIIKNTHS